MVRLPRAWLLLSAALGWSGCLLLTDPVNKPPVVTIVQLSDRVYRQSPALFTAVIHDEDAPAAFQIRWHEFKSDDPGQNQGCSAIAAEQWASLPPPQRDELFSYDVPFPFVANALGATCLCARTTDRKGAAGQACLRIDPENPKPSAKLTDLAGAAIPSQLPKCSQIQLSAMASQLSAEHPGFPPSDTVGYQWTLAYEGADPAGKSSVLRACDQEPPRPDAYRCLYAAVPGDYIVGLTVTDFPAGSSVRTASSPVSLRITVRDDTPACLLQSSPELGARWVLLARSSSLGAKYESRTFTVSSVRDDCEPFPARSDTPKEQKSMFVWSVLDGTQGGTTWEVQANPANANFFIVDQQAFPNARPGDTIGVRVEVRDTPAQALTVAPACADVATGICCGPNGCSGANDCIRWTTWTVQFQP